MRDRLRQGLSRGGAFDHVGLDFAARALLGTLGHRSVRRGHTRLERALLDVVELPLDLVRWEELIPPHRERILARGNVVYAKP